MKTWNPSAKNCSECSQLEPLTDKTQKNGKLKTVKIDGKFHCKRFGWIITKELSERSAACKIVIDGKKRKAYVKPRPSPGPEKGRSFIDDRMKPRNRRDRHR